MCIVSQFDAKACDKLCAQLRKRTEQLHLSLDLQEAQWDGLEEVARMLPKVATQQYLTPSGHCCVTDLQIRLPDGIKEQPYNSAENEEEPPELSWLAVVGSAFKAMARLRMFSGGGSTRLDTGFFVGLAACSNLTQLELDGSCQWQLDTELWSCPRVLGMWLPHVTQLVCYCGVDLRVLIQGLGPSLKQLDLRYTAEIDQASQNWWANLQKALSSCHQLQRISLPFINQPALDGLVSLPSLTHVKTVRLEDLKQPRVVSQSVWQELEFAEDTQRSVEIDQLAMLPLNTVQPVAVNSLLVDVPKPALSDGEAQRQQEQQRQAIATLAAAPKLQWAGELSIRNHTGADLFLDGAGGPAPDLDDAAVAAAVIAGAPCLQRLHTTIANLEPLAARGCHSLSLHYYVWSGMRADLAEPTAAALGAVFGASLTSLQLNLTYCSVDRSFWAAMSKHLPHLRKLHVTPCAFRDPTAAGLAQLVTSYKGPPLSISFGVTNHEQHVGELRAAGLLPQVAGDHQPAAAGEQSDRLEMQLPWP